MVMSVQAAATAARRVAAWPRRTYLRALILILVCLTGSPLLLRAANEVVATSSAMSFAASDVGGAEAFPDTTAASTGFTSIPTARAFFKAPRWSVNDRSGVAATAPAGATRPALAVLGMPVDAQHVLLNDIASRSVCLAPGSGRFLPCNGRAQRYDRIDRGRKFTLCDYDADCWHSTAVALAALGSERGKNPFSMPGQASTATFGSTTFRAVARALYSDGGFGEPGAYHQSFSMFVKERFPDFAGKMDDSVPVARLPLGGDAHFSTFVSREMLFRHGIAPGTPLLSINVFGERGESDCKRFKREAPCLLSSAALEKAALGELLRQAEDAGDSDGLKPGAIVLVAGGALTSGRCDDSPIAVLIGQLRKKGILTFVAAGNDGDAKRVRFPACASQAIAVGSLTRDGGIDKRSNGSRSNLVSLYADGDIIALPIRGPRIPSTIIYPDVGPKDCETIEEATGDEEAGYCTMRRSGDQYDTYLAGGTLLSTAVVSGMYLHLRQHFPAIDPETILTAMRTNTVPNHPSIAEGNVAAAAARLAASGSPANGTPNAVRQPAAHGPTGNPAIVKPGVVTAIVLAILVCVGGIVFVARRRRAVRAESDVAQH